MHRNTLTIHSAAVVLAVAAVFTFPANPHPLHAADEPPFFAPGDCALAVGGNVECGTLTVLEDRSDPGDGTVELAVVILKSTSPNPLPDPVIYLEGGPGGSIALGGAGLAAPFLAERDFILLEQRGNTLSKPRLDCPEHDAAFIDTFTTADPIERETEIMVAAAAACRDRLQAQGVDLGQYHSASTAADFADLRPVLGFDQWNLYGISYGTRLALTILRDHPEGLRSVVLDSVYPPSIKVYENFPADYDHSLQTVFDACAADPACKADYPDFEASYFQAVDALNAHPAREQALGKDIQFTGDDLRLATYIMLYDPAAISLIPLLADELNAGHTGMIGPLMESFGVYLSAVTDGKWWSVECYEEFGLNDLAAVAEAEKAYPRAPLHFKYRSDFTVCAEWGASTASPTFKDPVVSDVPVLLMAGEMDSSTPPGWAEEAARTLSNSHVIILPGQGHGVSTFGCGQQLSAAFIHDPRQPINHDCADGLSQQTFITRQDWVVTPIPYRLADVLSVYPQPLAQVVTGLMVAVSLVELLLAPGALLRLWCRKEEAPDSLARVSRLLATATAVIGLGVIAGLAAALIEVMKRGLLYLAVGVLRQSAWVFALMPVHALASLALAGLVVVAWRRGWWQLMGRVHVTLVAITGLGWSALMMWAWLR